MWVLDACVGIGAVLWFWRARPAEVDVWYMLLDCAVVTMLVLYLCSDVR
jgi:hypothetical protein